MMVTVPYTLDRYDIFLSAEAQPVNPKPMHSKGDSLSKNFFIRPPGIIIQKSNNTFFPHFFKNLFKTHTFMGKSVETRVGKTGKITVAGSLKEGIDLVELY